MSREKVSPISTFKPGMKGFFCHFIVLDKSILFFSLWFDSSIFSNLTNKKVEQTKTREGHTIHHFHVADNTASVHLTLWDALGETIESGDIIKMTNGLFWFSLFFPLLVWSKTHIKIIFLNSWCTLHNNHLYLNVGKVGKITRVGRWFLFLFNFYFFFFLFFQW